MIKPSPQGQTPIPADLNKPQRSRYTQQLDSLRYVLCDLHDRRAFGIEWMIRLFLVSVQFLYPVLLVRTVSGRFGFITERVTVEFYVLAKMLFYALAIAYGGYEQAAVLVIAVYLLSETVLYLTSLIFLADIYAPPISWRRSVLLLLINYVEIALGFAVLYLAANPLREKFVHPVQGVFFSFVTSAGFSYGDLYPVTPTGQALVLAHIAVMIVFIILIAQYVTNSLETLKAPSQIEK